MSDKFKFDKSIYTELDKSRICADSKASKEKTEEYRTAWRKDYARLLHSAAFRRLQGKTQLFPSNESDFYRNRLTHSLEVAQISKSIALKINHEYLDESNQIELDIVEIAGLAHDLGHPPFGHNGEEALDECMRDIDGGFEGNAQTLRILSRIEKKATRSLSKNGEALPISKGKDNRCGLNLTARALASILKYDNIIPERNKDRKSKKDKVIKGYYQKDKELVEFIKNCILGEKNFTSFKTIECKIMDIADDIAYSTYDLEDAFKAGFLNPLDLISAPNKLYEEIAKEVEGKLKEEYKNKPDVSSEQLSFKTTDVILIIAKLFQQIFEQDSKISFEAAGKTAYQAKNLANNGYLRTDFTSELVGMFISGIKFEPNNTYPALSTVYLDIETFKMIEVLKKLSYKSLIMSPMLKLAEYRGKDIVKKLFETLTNDNGYLLLPDDYQTLFKSFEGNDTEQKRLICDFIAGMTDRYALEFYNRLFGTNPETIHKPI